MNDAVLEIGRERWSQDLSRGIDFDHTINFCLAINFSRPADGYDLYQSHLCCCGGLPKGVTMKGARVEGCIMGGGTTTMLVALI